MKYLVPLLLILAACGSNQEDLLTANPWHLQHRVTNGDTAYPEQIGQTTFEFNPDYTARYISRHPHTADTVTGITWQMEGKNTLSLTKDQTQSQYKILELSKETLQFQPTSGEGVDTAAVFTFGHLGD